MLIIHVDVHVKPESVKAIKAATLVNARQGVKFANIFLDMANTQTRLANSIVATMRRMMADVRGTPCAS